MTRLTIKRFSRIGDFRAFQNWSGDGHPVEFQRVNLIYGTNGGGKSTLVCLMRECAEADIATPVANLKLDIASGTVRSSVDETDSTFWPRVKVFNADYVHDNLGFDDDDGPSPDSLLTLGKPNVDAQRI